MLSLERHNRLELKPAPRLMRDQVEDGFAMTGNNDCLALFDAPRQRG